MKIVGYLIVACVAMALLQAAAAALAIGLFIVVVVGACVRPRETFGLLAFVLVANLVETRPTVCLAIIGGLVLIASIGSRLRRSGG